MVKKSHRPKKFKNKVPGAQGDFLSRAAGDVPRQRADQRTSSISRPRISPIFTVTTQNILTPIVYSTSNQAGSFTFTFGQIANTSSFNAIFDQYKIRYVKLELKPTANAIGLYTASSNSFPALCLVIDYDNASNLSGVNAAQDYDNCMFVEAHESAIREIEPRTAVAGYSSSFTSFTNVGNMWVDCASSSQIHYGFKWYLPACTAAQTNLPSWNVYAEIIFDFRSVS